ncbi:MAG: hypothetical protein A2504_05235 [Bdellovibrionales bacterium RIFOXYD12_FULL_39_22]|nr:MAG: hypothetical protein A2385_06590 [Bdellovibrionales bacterium RIFOXYB1_FULL_39_21]OFZ41944.1 MAG: hypothetical protein A2485_08560 [Bdellovibrionales bacterium RIFOXYC12_FULL_39_17]OFZ50660.1 MAG: hypothetical protein A2404_05510 [Bdellovibrionales bacterium RIFOXYC1_FULL_39_130]OFZ72296.1 MAG: hypothetical protein A2451_05990 [Bdellovibrionales bacterium RIFOXYC2_FULL_39_8]OFZ77883.1 MAG: hypothetical protein A2560_00680 [Bdellovibrionales bacterium RIFOXYD1_FULL_39_84]OFZ93681.1 MAG:
MINNSEEIVSGLHSIAHAIRNPERVKIELVATDKGLAELRSKEKIENRLLKEIKVSLVSSHVLQEQAKKYFKEVNANYSRVQSQMFLRCRATQIYDSIDMYRVLEKEKGKRVICLDQVTDINNAAAIARTAAFYNVDYIVIPQKGSFSLTPSFSRISSGALEYVKIVRCNTLSKVVTTLKEMNVQCFGLSEEGNPVFPSFSKEENMALIFGAEDSGISPAVARVIDKMVAIAPQGKISSLNVSVASAVGMEKFFGK